MTTTRIDETTDVNFNNSNHSERRKDGISSNTSAILFNRQIECWNSKALIVLSLLWIFPTLSNKRKKRDFYINGWAECVTRQKKNVMATGVKTKKKTRSLIGSVGPKWLSPLLPESGGHFCLLKCLSSRVTSLEWLTRAAAYLAFDFRGRGCSVLLSLLSKDLN
jgi:hypothetical protein